MAIAHRGGAALAAENTLSAFAAATALGFRYLETDVRVSRDRQLVCFHDASVERVSDGRGRVQRHRLNELRALRLTGGDKIPTLIEALEAFPQANFTLDLKVGAAIEPLADLLRRHPPFAQRICVAGAWDGWLSRLHRLIPDVTIALGWQSLTSLVWRARTHAATAGALGPARFAHVPTWVASQPQHAGRLLQLAHQANIRVIVWTVNESATMHRLLDLGVDGIITDRPDVLREVLLRRNSWCPATTAVTSPERPRVPPGIGGDR